MAATGAGIKDYYRILGISPDADAKTIKSAYRKLARQYHPDVNKTREAEERFKEINEAYEVLSDPERRAKYDRLRQGFAEQEARSRGPGYQRVRTGWTTMGGPGGIDFDLGEFSSLFEDLFTGTTRPRPEPAHVPEQTVTLTLEQVMTGTTVKLTVEKSVPCPVCHGRDPHCPRCSGVGRVVTPQSFDVTVPPGVESGNVIRVGNHARLRVEVAPHPRFRRQGADLRARMTVPVPLAATGGELTVRPLTGPPLSVRIPPHTNSGQVLRLKGQGLPRRGGGRGDLLLEVNLRFPEPFTAREDELYRQLAAEPHRETGGGELHAD
ncbi:Molecular chaperone DnaJ [Candidatus Hydrogenisulfobacillus filiaventi]|uniref:Molecular chaperone DnaJ n=1 Tax=Candidatus Hydrogenisulfobacillus filiaventi TaxID=2707344 RepID=A0A6F8ZGN8_9FIRM|nr:J domain-containing protein [Bacillota bacterium]CAB1129155.1 Molecular chaperone DnaJ [Candidatus Hydrogenisulfobacillus filiaventi]